MLSVVSLRCWPPYFHPNQIWPLFLFIYCTNIYIDLLTVLFLLDFVALLFLVLCMLSICIRFWYSFRLQSFEKLVLDIHIVGCAYTIHFDPFVVLLLNSSHVMKSSPISDGIGGWGVGLVWHFQQCAGVQWTKKS